MADPGALVRMARFAGDPRGAPPAYLLFFCAGCKEPHFFRLRADPLEPGAPVWSWNGSRTAPSCEPSLVNNAVKPDGTKVVRCHLFLRDGVVEFLGDCAHAVRGKVPLAPWPESTSVFQARFFGVEET